MFKFKSTKQVDMTRHDLLLTAAVAGCAVLAEFGVGALLLYYGALTNIIQL